MSAYTVKITNRALTDMELIYEYIATTLQAPDTAIRQYNRIADAIELLADFPKRCKLLDSLPERERGFRQLVVDHFSAIFVVDDAVNSLFVFRVLYSASDMLEQLRRDS